MLYLMSQCWVGYSSLDNQSLINQDLLSAPRIFSDYIDFSAGEAVGARKGRVLIVQGLTLLQLSLKNIESVPFHSR